MVMMLEEVSDSLQISSRLQSDHVVLWPLTTFGNKPYQEPLGSSNLHCVQTFRLEGDLKKFTRSCPGRRKKIQSSQAKGGRSKERFYQEYESIGSLLSFCHELSYS